MTDDLLQSYRHMVTARAIDKVEDTLVSSGEAFFSVSGAGHEGSALLAHHLGPQDWLHCHYRDKALMLARGLTPRMFFDSVLCRKDSHSAGRQMSAHMSDPDLHVMSIVGPVGNNALQATGVAAAIKDQADKPLVLCAMGEGTTQQGEVLEAISDAANNQLPVLFLVEDNGYSISVPTKGRTFFERDQRQAAEFFGIPITFVNGWDAPGCMEVFGKAVADIRDTRGPTIVVMRTERLSNHTNADDQTAYRGADEIAEGHEHRDPIKRLEAHLLSKGISSQMLEEIRAEIEEEVHAQSQASLDGDDPDPEFGAKRPLEPHLAPGSPEYLGDADQPQLTMLEAIRDVLKHQIETDERVFLYGEDIEDPKGDVFGITRGLSTLRPAQVQNSPLAEATIVGSAVGRALAGQRPVAFLQFADFLPIAFNQLISELGSMYWRTNGGWNCPVIVMITCGGYRPGLGPFHAQSLESVAAHIPGVDVMMPSSAGDAAGMLNAAFQSGRPTLFFYPKNCLNNRDRTTSHDVQTQLAPIGQARHLRRGDELTLIGWGNTVDLLDIAAQHLTEAGVNLDLIDLRSLSPWDKEAVLASARRTKRVLVAHEDNETCGFGAEVLATIAQEAGCHVEMRRVARADTFVPCNYANQLQVLPSVRNILTTCAELCDLTLDWAEQADVSSDIFVMEALGSSPADETVQIVSWWVSEGDQIEAGVPVADAEADKASFELTCPASGRVEQILVEEGESVKVGTPLLEIRMAGKAQRRKPQVREEIGEVTITRNNAPATAQSLPATAETTTGGPVPVALSNVISVSGDRKVTNEELAERFPTYTTDDIVSRTGIQERYWLAEGQSPAGLAAEAVRRLLDAQEVDLTDVDLLICSTSSPDRASPTMTSRIVRELGLGQQVLPLHAYDLNAACSGYLYALRAAYDHLQGNPDGNVVIVTSETLSPQLDLNDFTTAILFGDAASATLVTSETRARPGGFTLHRPRGALKGDPTDSIQVPIPSEPGFIQMKGERTFSEAVRAMHDILGQACADSGLKPSELDLVVPHQANQRIIDAVHRRLKSPDVEMYSNIQFNGNTSSSTIPICLGELMNARAQGEHVGLVSFGAGYTLGAAILEVR